MSIKWVKQFHSFWQRLTSGSVNRQILGAAMTVAAGTVLVKLMSVGKELVVAWKFGTGDALDAFLIALLVPAFLINVIAFSFNPALIPTYIRVREQEGEEAAQKLFSGTTLFSLVLLVVTAVLMIAAAPLYLPFVASGFSAEKLDLTFRLLCTIAPIVLLTGVVAIWSAVLNAGERFALAALSPILTPTVSIGFLIFFSSLGAFALAAGLVVGAVLEIFLLGLALHRQGIQLRPKWYGLDSHLRRVANQYVPAVSSAVLICSTGLVDQAMAATLSPGSVAALSYGNRIIALPITLATTALSTAVVPYFSKMAACEDWVGMRHTLKHYLQLIFVVTVPLTGLLILFSEPIVQLLFQRGSFTANDTSQVAQIQNYYALQVPFYVGTILTVRLIEAIQKNQIFVWSSGLGLLLNIVLNYVFMQWLQVTGIALSTSCVIIFIFCFLLFFASNSINTLIGKEQ